MLVVLMVVFLVLNLSWVFLFTLQYSCVLWLVLFPCLFLCVGSFLFLFGSFDGLFLNFLLNLLFCIVFHIVPCFSIFSFHFMLYAKKKKEIYENI